MQCGTVTRSCANINRHYERMCFTMVHTQCASTVMEMLVIHECGVVVLQGLQVASKSSKTLNATCWYYKKGKPF